MNHDLSIFGDNFTFGLEIEFSSPGRREVAEDITAALGQEVKIFWTWKKSDGCYWEVKSDSSCCVEDFGGELVSPVLRGQEGVRTALTAADVVAEVALFDENCGFHIHVNAPEPERALQSWARWELCVMDALPSRRKVNRSYRWSTLSDERFIRDPQRAAQNALSDHKKRWALDTRYLKNRGTLEARVFEPPITMSETLLWLELMRAVVNSPGASTGPATLPEMISEIGMTENAKKKFLKRVKQYSSSDITAEVAAKLIEDMS